MKPTSLTQLAAAALLAFGVFAVHVDAQNRYQAGDGTLRVALAQQPLGPNGPSQGPDTMAAGQPRREISVALVLRHDVGEVAVWQQLDRLNRISDKLYIHIDMDVLDPREVTAQGNKVLNGPSSEQPARLFEEIFRRYPKASAIGFATIPPADEGGLSVAALNRMIEAAVRGVRARQQ